MEIALGLFDSIRKTIWFRAWKRMEIMDVMVLCMEPHRIALIT